jgi:hypothetical protein
MVVGFGRPNLRKNDSVWNGYYEHPITRFGYWYLQELTILFTAEIKRAGSYYEVLHGGRQVLCATSDNSCSLREKNLFSYF